MNWPTGRHGQVLAATYIVAFAGTVIGLVWALIAQATAAFVIFVVAQLAIWVLALRLRGTGGSSPAAGSPPGGLRLSGYQRAWHRLALGRELPAAVRRLGGRSA